MGHATYTPPAEKGRPSHLSQKSHTGVVALSVHGARAVARTCVVQVRGLPLGTSGSHGTLSVPWGSCCSGGL